MCGAWVILKGRQPSWLSHSLAALLSKFCLRERERERERGSERERERERERKNEREKDACIHT